jgi:hypothetical protein
VAEQKEETPVAAVDEVVHPVAAVVEVGHPVAAAKAEAENAAVTEAAAKAERQSKTLKTEEEKVSEDVAPKEAEVRSWVRIPPGSQVLGLKAIVFET